MNNATATCMLIFAVLWYCVGFIVSRKVIAKLSFWETIRLGIGYGFVQAAVVIIYRTLFHHA